MFGLVIGRGSEERNFRFLWESCEDDMNDTAAAWSVARYAMDEFRMLRPRTSFLRMVDLEGELDRSSLKLVEDLKGTKVLDW